MRVRTNPGQVPAQVMAAVQRVRQAGGKALLVGGSVVDMIQGQVPKDWDLEVYGLGYDRLVLIFQDKHPKTVGKAFGIVKVSWDDLDLDLSIPRRENKVGVGHKGFDVTFDPNMTVREAARRRDFTINAMALDLATGELHDPFGGQQDLAAGILRVTDPVTFVEDPLRALRAMQLLARKLKSVDPGTLFLIQSMRGTFGELPKERVLEEFRKLFLKAKRPSIGLQFLHDSRWIEHFPELHDLVGLEQHPEWHPEGDVWTHSKMAADEFAQIRHRIPEQDREAMAYGVFLHDLGKKPTTILPHHVKAGSAPAERLYTAYGHDKAGKPLADQFLRRIGASERTATLAKAVVEEHMQPWGLHQGEASDSAYFKLARRMQAAGGDLTHLGYMSHCDACATGKPHRKHDTWGSEASVRMFDYADKIRNAPALTTPRIQGRHLVALGYKPGNQFGPALKAAFDAQMENPTLTDDQLLAIAVHTIAPNARKNPVAELRKGSVTPYKSVRPGVGRDEALVAKLAYQGCALTASRTVHVWRALGSGKHWVGVIGYERESRRDWDGKPARFVYVGLGLAGARGGWTQAENALMRNKYGIGETGVGDLGFLRWALRDLQEMLRRWDFSIVPTTVFVEGADPKRQRVYAYLKRFGFEHRNGRYAWHNAAWRKSGA